jgi:uncharacterized protein YkwD
MRRLLVLICGLALAACAPAGVATPAPGLISTIVVQTAQAASMQTAAAPRPTLSALASCTDAVALAQDTTGEAGLSVPVGAKFSLTWQFSNTGGCNWHGYSVAFVSGERLGAADWIPLQDTPAGSSSTVSVELLAPASAGAYTSLFELRDALGNALHFGTATTFSVAVAVADAAAAAAPAPSTEVASGVPAPLPVPPPDCKYTQSATYPGEIVALINKARTDAGLPALTVNDKLVKSAQAHSTDMACNAYFAHPGLNNSTIHDRVVAAGYTPRFSEEMIFCSGYPKDAFTWWWGDKDHKDVILDTRVTELGVGYVYLPHSQCGSYYTVDLAAP